MVFFPFQRGIMCTSLVNIRYTELKLSCGNLCGRLPPAIPNHIIRSVSIRAYEKDHWLNIFMFCKLQHGKIEIIWYLQISKACQVVEFLDWCNLIRIQMTAKYKIRTKTMTIWDPISIRKVGRQHLCNQNQHTEGQRSKREKEKTRNGLMFLSLRNKLSILIDVAFHHWWNK
jgi:hypothetical protein